MSRAAALVLTALAMAACTARAEFDERSFEAIEPVLDSDGLHVCRTVETPDGLANQAVRSATYEVALDCAGEDSVDVVVDEYDSADARDAAIRGFEVQTRPRASGAAWTFGSTTVFVLGTADDDVFERITQALDALGAE
jgi:hypothetical protein